MRLSTPALAVVLAAAAGASASHAATSPAAARVAGPPAVPVVPLPNAASPSKGVVYMPIVGLGTGGYTGNASVPYGAYPECFNGCEDAQCVVPDSPGFSGCAGYVQAAVGMWLALGGRRVDNSASYHNQRPVVTAMAASGVPRGELFLTSKVSGCETGRV